MPRSVSQFLRSLDLAQYASVLEENGVDLEALSLLTDGDLQELGILLGHRRKILNAIANLNGMPTTGSPTLSPEQYTPKHLAEKILTSKSAIEGERKLVTVLFADLKGSMELLADRDPEEARKILDPVLERMMAAVHHFEGTVNQVMGDGIMALFGAPLTHEDHAVRACYAALRMQESVRLYAEEARRKHGASVRIRIGLNSGEVVVRAIGGDLHMDYTAVGQTTHLAARMEQIADPGAIVIAPETSLLAEGFVQVRSLGPVPVKGLATPIEVFELTGTGQAHTRLQVAALRGLTRFVGRATEVETLHRVLDQAFGRSGQVVAVVGEAGMGKSRLTYEFTHSHRVHGWLVLEAASVSYGKTTSYLSVIRMLKKYFKIDDRDDHREMRDKVIGRVLNLDRGFDQLVPPLLALLDVPVEDASWNSLEPTQRRQRTLDAVKQLLLREAQVQPLLVVFEDLHWIDGETQALLDGIVDALGSARMLLLVNYRPEYEHRWGNKTSYSQLRLDALPQESTEELLSTMLGPDPQLAVLKDSLTKQGNPFFLEETVRTLVETGALVGVRGAYRLTRPVDSLQVPSTVQTILAARIDRLPQEAKQLLQAASVIGKDLTYSLLAAIAEQTEEVLRRSLVRLQEAEFLYETQLFPDLGYTFKHALTHDVTYGSLLSERRRELHGQIVTAIERLFSDRISEQVERLAHHALRGQLWDAAVRYSRQAGNRALDRTAFGHALAHFENAKSALGALPRGREQIEQLIDLCFELRSALFPLSDFERQNDVLKEAHAHAEVLGDQRRLGWSLAYQTVLQTVVIGDQASALEMGARASAIAEALGDVGLRFVSNYYLGMSQWYAGELREAADTLGGIVALADSTGAAERFGLAGSPATFARFVLAWAFADMGEFAQAIEVGSEAVRIAQSVGHTYSEVWARTGLGYAHLRQGSFAAAISALEPALQISRENKLGLALPFVSAYLASAYRGVDRHAEAAPLAAEAVAACDAMRISGPRPVFATLLSESHLADGRILDARQQAAQAVELARTHQERGWEAWGWRQLGDALAQVPAEPEPAMDAYLKALEIATETGMRTLVPHCHFGLANIYKTINALEQAHRHFTVAEKMYCELGMRGQTRGQTPI